jgi:DNA/RNA endonuclease G (NUC1)
MSRYILKNFSHFQILFDTQFKLPISSTYVLQHQHKRAKVGFKSDIHSHSTKTFSQFKMDRGHIVPAIDVKSDSTFTMANVAPQYPHFNRILWLEVENFVRKHFKNHLIITSLKLDPEHFLEKQGLKLYIPIGFYKTIVKDEIVESIYLDHVKSGTTKWCSEKPYFL